MFAVSAVRSLIELLLFVMLGRGTLRLLAGRAAANNAVIRLFDLILAPPRLALTRLMPRSSQLVRDLTLSGVLLGAWLGLALVKLRLVA